MLLEVEFSGAHAAEDPNPKPGQDRKEVEKKAMTSARWKIAKEIAAAGDFLKKHETAKIIVIIDTHCFEDNGLLVYSEADVGPPAACDLKTVSSALGKVQACGC